MDAVIEFDAPGFIGSMRFGARVLVSFGAYNTYAFKAEPRTDGVRDAYARATRFLRLVERGYSPDEAFELARCAHYSRSFFTSFFDEAAHITDAPAPMIIASECEEGELITDWLAQDFMHNFPSVCGAPVSDLTLLAYYKMYFDGFMPLPVYLTEVAETAEGEVDTREWTFNNWHDMFEVSRSLPV